MLSDYTLKNKCQPKQCTTAGVPDELIQKGKDIKSISEIEETGNHFKLTVTTGSKVLTNSFTIGEEAELETITGEKIKVCIQNVKIIRSSRNVYL